MMRGQRVILHGWEIVTVLADGTGENALSWHYREDGKNHVRVVDAEGSVSEVHESDIEPLPNGAL